MCLQALPKSLIPRSNSPYTVKDLIECMMQASIRNGSVAGLLDARRAASTGRRSPTGEWFRKLVSKLKPEKVIEMFVKSATAQLDEMRRMGRIPEGGLEIAIDMHNISRFDKKHGDELIKAKPKNGTYRFEAYITIQCITKGRRLVLAALPVYALHSAAEYVPKIVEMCTNAGVSIRRAMLDREFFSVEAINHLNRLGVPYIIPCVNTPGVVEALRDYSAGRRNRVSRMMLEGNNGEAPYIMTIVRRKKKRRRNKNSDVPEEKFIGFATNARGVNVEAYSRRWGIETGYRMIGTMRARTRSKNPAARMFCFVWSVLVFNAWVMANAENAIACRKRGSSITVEAFKLLMGWGIEMDGIRPEPPPEPPPAMLP